MEVAKDVLHSICEILELDDDDESAGSAVSLYRHMLVA